MPRTLPAKTTSAIAEAVRRPRILVEIGFATPFRFSSRETVTVSSVTWTAHEMDLTRLALRAGGVLDGELRLADIDHAIAAVVLAEDIEGVPVALWALYGDAPFIDADRVALFAGEVLEVAEVAISEVRLGFTSEPAARAFAPAIFTGAPLVPVAAAGTVITWNGATITLEAKR